jgi:hypothetical protein
MSKVYFPGENPEDPAGFYAGRGRCASLRPRAARKRKDRGVQGSWQVIEQTRAVIKKVKEHPLFTRTKGEKKEVLKQIVERTGQLIEQTKEVIEQVGARCRAFKPRAKAKLQQIVKVGEELLPQINSWLKMGRVATIHAGMWRGERRIRK